MVSRIGAGAVVAVVTAIAMLVAAGFYGSNAVLFVLATGLAGLLATVVFQHGNLKVGGLARRLLWSWAAFWATVVAVVYTYSVTNGANALRVLAIGFTVSWAAFVLDRTMYRGSHSRRVFRTAVWATTGTGAAMTWCGALYGVGMALSALGIGIAVTILLTVLAGVLKVASSRTTSRPVADDETAVSGQIVR